MSSTQPDSSTSRKPPRPLEGRALVFGEVLFDHFPDGARVLGGAPFNVAWHLCGFGSDPVLVSAVGDDAEGEEILDRLHGWGLSTQGVGTSPPHPTGRVLVEIENGHPSFEIPPDQAWDDIPEPRLGEGSPGLLYHGTLAFRDGRSMRRGLDLRDRYDAPVFVDLNLRDPWWTEDLVKQCIQGVDWVKLSAEELGQVAGLPVETVEQCDEAARRMLQDFGVDHVVVTRGAEGALLVRRDAEILVAGAVDASDILDTVGAGDAFSAILSLGILQGWDESTTLQRANAFAVDICRIRGATSPDLSLYEKHLRSWAELPITAGEGDGLHILTLSIHGLVRGGDIELGRDADTGGQVSYVVDQARALAAHPEVEQVALVTRLIEDRRIDASYAAPDEILCDGARIVRLPFGPRRYLQKETLWPHLDALLDQLMRWVRAQPHPPDIIHGHYADAGYVGAQLSKLLGVPFIFTGHSLGRVKRERLLADGMADSTIEERYKLTRRIEGEEQALEAADLVITSTHQEVHEQFELYDHYVPERMRVVPPGVDLARFSPPPALWQRPPIVHELARFLVDPEKPMVLAIARADERKNFAGLVRAYAETPGLREAANLCLVAGNRDDIRGMAAPPRRVLTELLQLIDTYDLYGSAAYPKRHRPEDVPELFRLAAYTKGVFVNPALTEPFGLTLLEAAATGLPVVATNDGGPRDILEKCGHGVVVDPLDTAAMGEAIFDAISKTGRWGRWSKNGVSHVHAHYSWSSHARSYVDQAKRILTATHGGRVSPQPSRLARIDRLLITDVDDTLTGDDEGLSELMRTLERAGDRVGFGIATGRSLDSVLQLLDDIGVYPPDVLVTATGTEIRYGNRLVLDRSWERQIRHRWDPDRVLEALAAVPGVHPDGDETTAYRLRFELDHETTPTLREIRRTLRQAGIRATPILDHESWLDVVPMRASPGLALRFFGFKWNLQPDRILVAGDSGNDRDMLEGETLGVVVGNHTPELDVLHGRPRVHFAEGRHAWGVLEGLDHYDFFREIRPEAANF